MSPTMRLTVEPGDLVPALARSFVRSCLDLLDRVPSDDALLLTSEAVTNSVRHARTERVVVSIEPHGDRLWIGVADDDHRVPVVLPHEPTREGGFGVRLIAELAEEWGVDDLVEDGKQVWFEVRVAAAP